MELAHPAMHRSIRSLGCSLERSCDHPASEGDPEAVLEASVPARRLLRGFRMPFAREVGGPPLWPVLVVGSGAVQDNDACIVCLCRSPEALGSLPLG